MLIDELNKIQFDARKMDYNYISKLKDLKELCKEMAALGRSHVNVYRRIPIREGHLDYVNENLYDFISANKNMIIRVTGLKISKICFEYPNMYYIVKWGGIKSEN